MSKKKHLSNAAGYGATGTGRRLSEFVDNESHSPGSFKVAILIGALSVYSLVDSNKTGFGIARRSLPATGLPLISLGAGAILPSIGTQNDC